MGVVSGSGGACDGAEGGNDRIEPPVALVTLGREASAVAGGSGSRAMAGGTGVPALVDASSGVPSMGAAWEGGRATGHSGVAGVEPGWFYHRTRHEHT